VKSISTEAILRIDARGFEARHRELVATLGAAESGSGSVECVGCRACQDCTFCRDSERLCRCHYCVRSALCTDCSHCRGCRALVACTHCIDTETSVRSSYLVRCAAMADCTYSFGCVGLARKDFHILNEPFDRSTYFETTRRLMRELGLAAPP
jgi:hypothetical protein